MWIQWCTCDPAIQHLVSNPSCSCHHLSLTEESFGHAHRPSHQIDWKRKFWDELLWRVLPRAESFMSKPYTDIYKVKKNISIKKAPMGRHASTLLKNICLFVCFTWRIYRAFDAIYGVKCGYREVFHIGNENQMSILAGIFVQLYERRAYTLLNRALPSISAHSSRSFWPAAVPFFLAAYCTFTHKKLWRPRPNMQCFFHSDTSLFFSLVRSVVCDVLTFSGFV